MERVRGAVAGIPLDRIAYVVGAVIAALVVIGGLLLILDANKGNFIVSLFVNIGDFFASPFEKMFKLDSRDGRIALNWGIGAFVYFILGVVIAGLVGRLTRRGAE